MRSPSVRTVGLGACSLTAALVLLHATQSPPKPVVADEVAVKSAVGARKVVADVKQVANSGFYGLHASDIHGNAVDFAQFRGKTLLITNVASF